MTKLRGGVGLLAQKQKDYIIIRLQVPNGKLTSEQMEGIGGVLDKYGRGYAVPTVRKGIEIPWIKFNDANEVVAEFKKLGLRAGSCGTRVRSVVACAGLEHCKNCEVDAKAMYERLVDRYYERDTPTKFKISLAGCSKACSHPHVNDFGIIGHENGYSLVIGGKGGRHPSFGHHIVDGLSEEEVFGVLDRSLSYFKERANGKERIGEVIKRNGIEGFKDHVLRGEDN